MMSPETLAIAIEARKVLQSPKAWTKGTFARDADGNKVSSYDKNAVCWCLEGAIHKASDSLRGHSTEIWNVMDEFLKEKYGYSSMVAYNDHTLREHSDIVRMLDSFIKEAEKEKPNVGHNDLHD